MPRFLLALVLSALLLPAASAQPIAPGLDAAALDALFDRPPKVEVNLRGSLLRLAASAASSDDPETADLISGLRGITVRVYALDAARAGIAERLAQVGQRLDGSGWQTLVRVRPDEEDTDDVSIFVREAGDLLDGMIVMALDGEDGDASFVFIDGPIDLAQVDRLSDRFAGTRFEDAPAPPAPPAPPSPRSPLAPAAPPAPVAP